jgi:hypothetical protein
MGSLADSLLASDRVALEVTGSCWEVARLLERRVDRVVVVSPQDTASGRISKRIGEMGFEELDDQPQLSAEHAILAARRGSDVESNLDQAL